MGQALYRKYRSKSLDEVVGQAHITDTLKNTLKAGKISHAYLFTGPRGVGKTSIARILAHEVNKLNYLDDQPHLDIIEIDAASNRRIDEIRELRERVHIAPTSATYKVYIIDEVHMLTKEAFNALLKTLEEPPAHVIFILATTEAHKLPDTIVSRTQRFAFKPINDAAVVGHLRMIAQAEKITIDDSALGLIARHGSGSFRDSISLLDQISGQGKPITQTDVEQLLGIVPEEAVSELSDTIQAGQPKAVMTLLGDLLERSSPSQIAKQLGVQLQTTLLSSPTGDTNALAALMRTLIDVPASHDALVALQLAVLETALKHQAKTNDESYYATATPDAEPIEEPVPEIDTPPEPESGPEIESLEPHELWPQTLAEIKKHYATLYSIARMAKATTGDQEIRLEFEFPFHQKRLNEAKNLQIITSILQKISGHDYVVKSLLKNAPKKSQAPEPLPANTAISTISNIFGDAEVLES